MKLSQTLVLLAATLTSAVPSGTKRQTQATFSYDPWYDEGSYSLAGTACSDGDNGLITAGYTTLDSLPTFPNIGGVFTVEGWDSVNCGSCYQVTYEDTSIYVLAVDHADAGFNVAKQAMDELTGGRAEELGRVDVTWVDALPSDCGL